MVAAEGDVAPSGRLNLAPSYGGLLLQHRSKEVLAGGMLNSTGEFAGIAGKTLTQVAEDPLHGFDLLAFSRSRSPNWWL
jgi:hypothetical protein